MQQQRELVLVQRCAPELLLAGPSCRSSVRPPAAADTAEKAAGIDVRRVEQAAG